MKFHSSNSDWIEQEANKAKEQEDNSEFRKIVVHKWDEGATTIRIFPSWAAHGRWMKMVLTHFSLPPNNSIATSLFTWPDEFDSCPIYSAIEEIESTTGADLGKQKATEYWYGQGVIRGHEDLGVVMFRFTVRMKNWLINQCKHPKIGDITDPERGFDVTVEKKQKKGKGGTFTSYELGIVPERCPISEDPEQMKLWEEQMYDIDKIYSPPNDEKHGELRSLADGLFGHYMRRRHENKKKESSDDYVPEDSGQTAKPEVESKPDKPKSDLGTMKHDKVPACFAGLPDPEKHSGGGIGYDTNLEKCLVCPHDMKCEREASDR